MKTVLIVGGAGYIGSHVNKCLHRAGYSTIVFDNLSTGHREFVKWGKFVEGDILKPQTLRDVFSSCRIDAVIHLAAFAHVGESVTNPEKYYTNNVTGTLNLLSAMREFNTRYIVFSSSCATYGTPAQLPIVETTPQSPVNPYGRTKLMMEQVLSDYDAAYGIRNICLRYFNAAGASTDGEIGEWHTPETHLIPLVLQRASGNLKELCVFGNDYPTPDGTCIRDYVHVEDIAGAHHLAMEYLFKNDVSNAFNLGTGQGTSVKALIDTAQTITGLPVPYSIVSRRSGDPASLVADAQKAKSILNWTPTYSKIEDIISHAWAWQKKHQP